jgi:hypothetical protein
MNGRSWKGERPSLTQSVLFTNKARHCTQEHNTDHRTLCLIKALPQTRGERKMQSAERREQRKWRMASESWTSFWVRISSESARLAGCAHAERGLLYWRISSCARQSRGESFDITHVGGERVTLSAVRGKRDEVMRIREIRLLTAVSVQHSLDPVCEPRVGIFVHLKIMTLVHDRELGVRKQLSWSFKSSYWLSLFIASACCLK